MITYQIYDNNFKNIFDTYPQGILDIVHQVIIENFPKLILNNCSEELLEKYPKDMIEKHPQEVLKNEEFKLNFKQKLPNEFNLKNGERYLADMPIETFEDLILNLEFQTYIIDFIKESIFNLYPAVLHKKHKKYVFTVVFSTVHDEHKLIYHRINPCEEFTMLIISLKALNLKQTLNNSSYKIANNIDMSDKEKALFLLSPTMNKKKRVEALKETIRLTEENKKITPDEYQDMIKIQMNFASEWFGEDDSEELGGLIMSVLTPKAIDIGGNVFKKIIVKQA